MIAEKPPSGRRTVIPVSGPVLFSFAATAAVLIVLSVSAGFTFHSADGGAPAFAFRWLSLPFLVFLLFVAFRTEVLGKGITQKVISAVVITVFLCSVGSGGLLWINAGFGGQADILVSGAVVGKSSGGIKGYPTITVQDSEMLRMIRLEVSRPEYERVEVGRTYRKPMRIGVLGIMYAYSRE